MTLPQHDFFGTKTAWIITNCCHNIPEIHKKHPLWKCSWFNRTQIYSGNIGCSQFPIFLIMQWNLLWTHRSLVFAFHGKWISVIVLEIIVNSEQWHCDFGHLKKHLHLLLFHLGTRKAIKKKKIIIHLVTRTNKTLRALHINWCTVLKSFFNYRITNFCPSREFIQNVPWTFSTLGCFCVVLLSWDERWPSEFLSALHFHQRNFFFFFQPEALKWSNFSLKSNFNYRELHTVETLNICPALNTIIMSCVNPTSTSQSLKFASAPILTSCLPCE